MTQTSGHIGIFYLTLHTRLYLKKGCTMRSTFLLVLISYLLAGFYSNNVEAEARLTEQKAIAKFNFEYAIAKSFVHTVKPSKIIVTDDFIDSDCPEGRGFVQGTVILDSVNSRVAETFYCDVYDLGNGCFTKSEINHYYKVPKVWFNNKDVAFRSIACDRKLKRLIRYDKSNAKELELRSNEWVRRDEFIRSLKTMI